jgi:flagellar biosynthesis protein FliQ
VNFWNEVILPALTQIFSDMMSIIPLILAALLILLVGYFISKIIENIVRRVLNKMGFNTIAEKAGVSNFLKNAGFDKEVSWVIGKLTFWMLFLIFLLSAAETLQLTTLALSLNQVVAFIPKLIVVVLILVLGAMLARISGKLVTASAANAGLDFAPFLGKLVNNIILIAISFIAISQLDIDSAILDTTFGALVGAFALAIALTLGLGSRDISHNIICGVYARKTFRIGQTIEINNIEGKIVQIGTINTVLQSPKGLHTLPNSDLIDNITHIKAE